MLEAPYLLVILALPFLGSLVSAFLPTRARTLAACALLICFYPSLADGQVVRHEVPWLPSLDLDLTLRLTGFSWLR
ncbi:hypothetical protein [Novosphingobium sp. JCM 18896]|uniref:hypothetical protein n=1 Tax=Novosphingobium sp. JCM 18896 TaxID=2989731 RepID=UPI002222654F|nr:hypothetical protein [Novosphingobium sp. JCM 18896]MCW1432061.1 hypothetical protein [Novosphingobium sp. JCM 18896]